MDEDQLLPEGWYENTEMFKYGIDEEIGLTYEKYHDIVMKRIHPKENPYTHFNRFGVPTTDPFMSNIAYIFFTKPNLNLNAINLSNSNYFSALNDTDYGRNILSSLSVSDYVNSNLTSNGGNFIKILSNSIMNFETKDNSLAVDSVNENFIGYKLMMPDTFIESLTADTISLNFLEYDDLRVTNIIKTWVEYIAGVKRGIFSPTQASMEQKIIDYMSSIYYFLCGPDGHTIKFFTKLTGVFPINIPYSNFSWERGAIDIKKLSVSFQYQLKEDLDMEIIEDFIKTTSITTGTTILSDDYTDSWATDVIIYDGSLHFMK